MFPVVIVGEVCSDLKCFRYYLVSIRTNTDFVVGLQPPPQSYI